MNPQPTVCVVLLVSDGFIDHTVHFVPNSKTDIRRHPFLNFVLWIITEVIITFVLPRNPLVRQRLITEVLVLVLPCVWLSE